MEMIIAFKFLHIAILDFMMSLHCPIVSNKRTSAFQKKRQCGDVMKSKMAARGEFKSKISSVYFFFLLLLLLLLLLLNVMFPLSSKICNLDIIWSNLALT